MVGAAPRRENVPGARAELDGVGELGLASCVGGLNGLATFAVRSLLATRVAGSTGTLRSAAPAPVRSL